MAPTTTKAKTGPKPGPTTGPKTGPTTGDPAATADGEPEQGGTEEPGQGLPAEDEVAADDIALLPPPEARLDTDIHETRLSSLRNPVDRFLSEARSFPRLSEEDERALGLAVRQRGDLGAARKLVVHNL